MKNGLLQILIVCFVIFLSNSCGNYESKEGKESIVQIDSSSPKLDTTHHIAEPEIHFELKRRNVRQYGLSFSQVGQSLREMLFIKKLSLDSILNSTVRFTNINGKKVEVPMIELVEIKE